jgi:nicotinamide-nucleotide amidase
MPRHRDKVPLRITVTDFLNTQSPIGEVSQVRAEVLATGDEIRNGSVVDTNSAYIALRLEEAGIEVKRHSCVGDDVSELAAVLNEMAERSDVAVVTGGLGPTDDDVTAEAAALAADVTLALSREALDSIDAFFKNHQRLYSPANRKQALLPIGSVCISNPIGTAPGFHVKVGGCAVFCLPGVPNEMRRMFSEDALPMIRRLQSSALHSALKKHLTVFGMTEATVAEKLAGFESIFPQLRLGLCAVFPEISVRVSIRSGYDGSAEKIAEAAAEWIRQRLVPRILSMQGESMVEVVGNLLKHRDATVGVAESCTGGLVAHMLTNVSGSSDYFNLGVVTYANRSKVEILGVDPRTIDRCGAVHEDTAVEMAEGVRKRAGADYGLSTTGIAGPTGGTVDKPVGTVCIGLSGPAGVQARRYHFRFDDRGLNKKIFAYTALNVLRRRLLEPISK